MSSLHCKLITSFLPRCFLYTVIKIWKLAMVTGQQNWEIHSFIRVLTVVRDVLSRIGSVSIQRVNLLIIVKYNIDGLQMAVGYQ